MCSTSRVTMTVILGGIVNISFDVYWVKISSGCNGCVQLVGLL